MANRRMFSLSIVDSDDFLDMPPSTRCLYFDLGMRVDDDGFVSPKKVMRLTGASEDDLKILIAKKFVIRFQSGVVVVTHHKMHNYIQKDRYTKTMHLEELAMLSQDSNGGYRLDTQCIQDGYELDTQVRLELGKDRVRLGEKKTEKKYLTSQDFDDLTSNDAAIDELLLKVQVKYPRFTKDWLTDKIQALKDWHENAPKSKKKTDINRFVLNVVGRDYKAFLETLTAENRLQRTETITAPLNMSYAAQDELLKMKRQAERQAELARLDAKYAEKIAIENKTQ
jgi:hypothetical protein